MRRLRVRHAVGRLATTFLLGTAVSVCSVNQAVADVAPPPMPAYLQTAGAGTATPIISGVVQDPQDRMVTGKFYVTDSSGNPVGGSPTAYGDVPSGERVTYKFPEGVLQAGATYRWSIQACLDDVCSGRTAPQDFQAGSSPAPNAPSEQPTASKTLTGTALASFSGIRSSQSTCSACGIKTGGDFRVGSDGASSSTQWVSGLKPDLSAIPAGARIINATLSLTQCKYPVLPPPGGGTVMRPNGVPAPPYWSGLLDIYPADADIAAAKTGNELAAAADDTAAVSNVGSRQGWDLTPVVQSWISGDVPNDGLVLKAHDPAEPDWALYCSPTQSDSAAAITVTYEALASPGKPRQLVVAAGDSGLRAHWSAPADSGNLDGITGYTLQVIDSSGKSVRSVTPTDTSSVVNGLTNGTAYTIRVAAVNAVGTGQPAVSSSVKPVAVDGGAGPYAQAVQQFLDAKQGLKEGTYPSADAAIQASSVGALFGDQLSLEAPQDLFIGSDMSSAGEGLRNGVNSLTSTLVVPSADRSAVSVYTTDELTYSTGATITDPSDGSVTCCKKVTNYLFSFSTQGGPKMSGFVDASQAEDEVGSSSDITAVSDTLSDPGGSDGTDPAPLDLSASQHSSVPAVIKPNIFYPNRRGIQNWAWNNAYHRNFNGYGDDCTDFASMALHYGGEMKETSRWKWYTNHTNDHYWGRDSHWATYSWGGAPHLAQYLGNYGSDWVGYVPQVNYGNIVFANWRGGGFKGISHTGVVVAITGGNDFVIAQHSNNTIEWFREWVAYARSHGHNGTYWVASVHSR